MVQLGSITLYTGCMHAGKTREVLDIIARARLSKRKVILFLPRLMRWDPFIEGTGSRLRFKANRINRRRPQQILKAAESYEIVVIDEIQLFSRKLRDVVKKMFLRGQHVYMTGLDANYRGKPFVTTSALKLLPETKVINKTAICNSCGNDATRTYDLKTQSRHKVFEPRCLACWTKS